MSLKRKLKRKAQKAQKENEPKWTIGTIGHIRNKKVVKKS